MQNRHETAPFAVLFLDTDLRPRGRADKGGGRRNVVPSSDLGDRPEWARLLSTRSPARTPRRRGAFLKASRAVTFSSVDERASHQGLLPAGGGACLLYT